jgi:hypothetical protein
MNVLQYRMYQVGIEQRLHVLALHLPLVDLIQEGPQDFLNCFAWLGLDVGNQLIVALLLIFVKHCLVYINEKKVSTEIECPVKKILK